MVCPAFAPVVIHLTQHMLFHVKGGFVSKRHDNVRDLFTALINKVCVNIETELQHFPLENELLDLKTSNRSPEYRFDIKAKCFWNRG